MSDFRPTGPPCELNGSWTEEIPEPTVERKLAASLYLTNDLGIKGPLDEIAYRLTVELAKARQANRDMWLMMDAEVKKWRARHKMERHLANDLADELAVADNELELLALENEQLTHAAITAQERLDNALSMIEDMPINWEGLKF